jgi:uncharacterized protein (TIGR02147 family)
MPHILMTYTDRSTVYDRVEMLKKGNSMLEPPLAKDFESPVSYLRARLDYRRSTEAGFSVTRECMELRRCSKALVSMILSGQRPITLERVEDLATLMGLSVKEKHAFRYWIQDIEKSQNGQADVLEDRSQLGTSLRRLKRKEVSQHLLSDWLNVYVKDAFRFKHIQENPNEVVRFCSTIAKPSRVLKSLDFLLREGYLRRTVDGRIVEDTPLMIAESIVSKSDPQKSLSEGANKIRAFHKQALLIAKDAIDLFTKEKRVANALVLPLSSQKKQELIHLIEEFSEKLKTFAEDETVIEGTGQLYQILVNLCPVGGPSIDEQAV